MEMHCVLSLVVVSQSRWLGGYPTAPSDVGARASNQQGTESNQCSANSTMGAVQLNIPSSLEDTMLLEPMTQ